MTLKQIAYIELRDWSTGDTSLDACCHALVPIAHERTGCHVPPVSSKDRLIFVCCSQGLRSFGVVYMAASRELRRAEVINRSPVLALYSEMRECFRGMKAVHLLTRSLVNGFSVSGRQVIRAFGGTSRVIEPSRRG